MTDYVQDDVVGGWVFLERRRPLSDRGTRLRACGLLLEDLAVILDPRIVWAMPVPRPRFIAPVANVLDRVGNRLVSLAEAGRR